MKKVLFALCAVSLLAFSACKKDNVEPENTAASQPGAPADQMPTGEGYYNPGAKIVEIITDDVTAQRWSWENGLVMSIQEADENGNMGGANTFTYSNKRLNTAMMTIMDMPISANYTYQGDLLTKVDAVMSPMPVASILYDHNANNKISHLTVNVNEQVLSMLGPLLGSGLLGNLGDLFGKGPQEKMEITGSNIAVDMEWEGNNVSRQLVSAELNGTITLGEIRQFVNIDSLLGSMINLLVSTDDSLTCPVTIVVNDTIDMTYDSHPNPYCGFLGRMEPSAYSANNVLTSHNAASAKVTLTAPTIMGNIPIPFSRPLPLGGDDSFTYTYNAAGFPETVTNGVGSVTRIIYQQ